MRREGKAEREGLERRGLESSAERQHDSVVSAGFPQPRPAWSQGGSPAPPPPGPAAPAEQNPHQASVLRSASEPRGCTPAPERRHPPPPSPSESSSLLHLLRLLPSGPPLSLLQAVLPATSAPSPGPPPSPSATSLPAPGTVPALQKEPALTLANRPGPGEPGSRASCPRPPSRCWV